MSMNSVTLKGKPIELQGRFVKAGDMAPDFCLVSENLSDFTLKDGAGGNLVLNIFPSLDTDVCANSVRRFNKMATELPHTRVLCISRDLPFAQQRFCTVEGLFYVTPLSDFRPHSDFGEAYGVLIAGGPMAGLLARAVVVINPEGKVVYSELVPEITKEPDYGKALQAMSGC